MQSEVDKEVIIMPYCEKCMAPVEGKRGLDRKLKCEHCGEMLKNEG